MGFGILFFGYCVTYILSLNPYGVFFRLFGCVLMLVGCNKLTGYQSKFRLALYSLSVLTLVTALETFSEISAFLYDNLIISSRLVSPIVDSVLTYSDAACVLVYHVFLLLAIKAIAKETEVADIEAASFRNLFFVVLYFVLRVIAYLPLSFQEVYNKYLALPIFILNLSWMVLNVILLFKCYAKICDESDVEMEQKPSRFEFVNRYRAELAERQRIADEKYAKREQERKNKKKK